MPDLDLNRDEPPRWPPDVFGLCAATLRETGAYHLAVTDWPPRNNWSDWAAKAGARWRVAWCRNRPLPKPVLAEWAALRRYADMPLSDLLLPAAEKHRKPVVQAMLNLLALADEASENAGFPFRTTDGEASFYFHARKRLLSLGLGSSLCERIPHGRGRVLPKMHTGQSGLTLRSLSHNLAFCPPSEIIPKWRPIDTPQKDQHYLNLLLIPWPLEIEPSAIAENGRNGLSPRNMPDDFGYFRYVPSPEKGGAAAYVRRCLENCPSDRFPHGVVLPEMSLNQSEYHEVRDAVLSRGCFLVTGVVGEPGNGSQPVVNRLHFDVPLVHTDSSESVRFVSFTQSKHHRWLIDKSQIEQYGLQNSLDANRCWWEHCDFRGREQSIAPIRSWLTVAPLICEDLARPDPVQEIVRSIGPNLVLALLMDGPQLRTRWARRYASVLSDDPGCSVLTLTSVGMIRLTEQKYPKKRARVIAMWQNRAAEPIEIEIEDDADAVLLRIAKESRTEWTADGRSDLNGSYYAIIEKAERDIFQVRAPGKPVARSTTTGGS